MILSALYYCASAKFQTPPTPPVSIVAGGCRKSVARAGELWLALVTHQRVIFGRDCAAPQQITIKNVL